MSNKEEMTTKGGFLALAEFSMRSEERRVGKECHGLG